MIDRRYSPFSGHMFDNYIVDRYNYEAIQTCLQAALKPTKLHQLLIIVAANGNGKTHLLNAIGHTIILQRPKAVCKGGHMEGFVADYIASVRANNIEYFRRCYSETDVLLIDDIHHVVDRYTYSDEFVRVASDLLKTGAQLVLTCDRHPDRLPFMQALLHEHANITSIVQVIPPDRAARIAILHQQINKHDHIMDDNIIEMLVDEAGTGISTRGLIDRLAFLLHAVSTRKQSITLLTARELLDSIAARG